jgi:predicted  nucleic acid-binding Zn-ribbon protein
MKELFLKEYEDLITEKNNEIKGLNEQLSKVSYDKKDYAIEIKELKYKIKTMEDDIKDKDKRLKGTWFWIISIFGCV